MLQITGQSIQTTSTMKMINRKKVKGHHQRKWLSLTRFLCNYFQNIVTDVLQKDKVSVVINRNLFTLCHVIHCFLTAAQTRVTQHCDGEPCMILAQAAAKETMLYRDQHPQLQPAEVLL